MGFKYFKARKQVTGRGRVLLVCILLTAAVIVLCLTNGSFQPLPSDDPARLVHRKNKLAITYLTQKRHGSYGRDSMSLLEQSLNLLHDNVLPYTKADVLIFHEGDFTTEDQANLTRNRPNVQFVLMPKRFWYLPDFLKNDDQNTWVEPRFKEGYRHMIRWYSLNLFTFAHAAGYDYVMRSDEESFIWSPIEYDLADFMASHNYQYGYRMMTHEAKQDAVGFAEMVHAFLVMFDKPAEELLAHCNPSNLDGLTTWNWNRWDFYNNFFITRVEFWMRPDVQHYLKFMDRTGGMYTHRWNDNLMQTTAVQIFMPKEQVYKFDDWTYEHATLDNDNRLLFGGIVGGKNDSNGEEYVKKFKASHNGDSIKCVEEDICWFY